MGCGGQLLPYANRLHVPVCATSNRCYRRITCSSSMRTYHLRSQWCWLPRLQPSQRCRSDRIVQAPRCFLLVPSAWKADSARNLMRPPSSACGKNVFKIERSHLFSARIRLIVYAFPGDIEVLLPRRHIASGRVSSSCSSFVKFKKTTAKST